MKAEDRTEAQTLDYLRKKIMQIEGFKGINANTGIAFGVAEIDSAFPNQVLPCGAVHEFVSRSQEETAASVGFIASLASKLVKVGGAILWITKSQTVFPPGLTFYGLEPDRIVFAELARDQEALWAMEEGLRTKTVSAVIGEIADADLTSTRRLQLAVEESGVTGFLMRINPRKTGSSSCFSSWHIRPVLSETEDNMPGVGFPRWDVELLKVRNGTPGRWNVECRAGEFRLVNSRKSTLSENRLVKVAG